MIKFTALALVALLCACATPYDELRSYSGTDAGTLVASVGMATDNTMNYATVEFRKKGTSQLGSLHFSPKAAAAFGGTSIDFRDAKGAYSLIRKQLPPGDYEVFRYNSGANYGTTMVWYKAPENFVVPFTVKPGETTYLGQFRIGLNLIGGRPTSSFLEISNERLRDVAGVQKAGTKLNDEADAITKSEASGTKRLN
jgi:hypothetical protein